MNNSKNISRGCCFSRNAEGVAQAESISSCHKMEVYDWLGEIPDPLAERKIFEVQFKNTRKSFFEVSEGLEVKKGDIVVVESTPGIDVGIVSLTSDLVELQMKKHRFSPQDCQFKKIIRKANSHDIEKWQEAISLEHNTMIRSRQISSDLGLKMKIGDVEYQGDRLKAIFYYIADERVDFRQLIKVLAEQFRVRVEMKQIGARQEAGRIGGIAACGRELCCSTWQNSFQSVGINAARHQEISLNPQKLAGQCGKLKCCLNYEVDNYVDARKRFPRLNAPLEALDGTYHLVKSDIFKGIMWFSPDPQSAAILIPLGIDRVRQIVALNRKGTKVDKIEDKKLVESMATVETEPEYKNVVGEESITRFDNNSKNRRNNNNRNSRGKNRNNSKAEGGNGNNGDNNANNENQNGRSEQRQRQQQPRGENNANGQRRADNSANSQKRGETDSSNGRNNAENGRNNSEGGNDQKPRSTSNRRNNRNRKPRPPKTE